jgi:transposase-like protein
MARRRYSREQWSQWVSAQLASGESAAAFCERRKVPLQAFYQWRRKLAVEPAAAGGQCSLVPLKIVAGWDVQIELACGATIKIPGDNESATKMILAALVQLGRQG